MNLTYLFLIAAVSVMSCTGGQKQADGRVVIAGTTESDDRIKLSPKQAQNAGIEVGRLEEKEAFSIIRASGVLEVPPHNIFYVSVPMGGFLKRITLLPGTQVRKGEVLATLEDQQYIQLQEDYLTAKTKLNLLHADLTRQRQLNATKATSDKIFQQAESAFEIQKIAVKGFSEKLKLIGLNPDRLEESNISRTISIYSPITGYVTKVHANSGKYIHPADVIFEVVNPAQLHVNLKVFEQDASLISKGQKVTFYNNGDTVHRFQGDVHLINPHIDGDRTIDVHCEISGSHRALLPGTFINAEIQSNSKKAKVLPEEAIVSWNNKTYIFVQEDKLSYRMVLIEAGMPTGGYSEIRSEIPTERIVVKNAYTLLMVLKNSAKEG